MKAKYRPSASQKNVNAATLKWHLKKIWPEIFRLIIYTSDGRLGHFFYYNYSLGEMTNIKPGFLMARLT